MSRSTTEAVLHLRPAELLLGDIVDTDGDRARVVSEPMTMHRGLSPFDTFELLIGVYVQSIGKSDRRLQVWLATERIVARRDFAD